MAARIDDHFLDDKLGIVPVRYKSTMLSEECMPLYLCFKVIYSCLYLLEYCPFEGYILDNIHLCSYFFLYPFIANEASTPPRKELLRIFAE